MAVFNLVKAGSLRPVFPVQIFPFSDIASAFRLMRTGRHMGKLVISNEGCSDTKSAPIRVRPAPRSVRICPDKCYLIVGGLRGLCSSLAIYLAKMGARYIAVMSRSGDSNVPQKIINDIRALGCDLQVCKGDVCKKEDVSRVLSNTKVTVGGIIQGAMLLRVSFTQITSWKYCIDWVLGPYVCCNDHRRIPRCSELQSARNMEFARCVSWTGLVVGFLHFAFVHLRSLWLKGPGKLRSRQRLSRCFRVLSQQYLWTAYHLYRPWGHRGCRLHGRSRRAST